MVRFVRKDARIVRLERKHERGKLFLRSCISASRRICGMLKNLYFVSATTGGYGCDFIAFH